MGMLSSFLHPEKGYKKAQQTSDKYFQQALQFQLPTFQQGQNAYSKLEEFINNLSNPEQLQSRFISGYEESPAAKMEEEMAKQRGLNAAASMGLSGSTPALNALQTGTSNIVNADRQKYIDDLLQKYLAAAGIAGSVYNTGANAGSNLFSGIQNQGNNQAQLEFNKANAPGDLFGQILGTGAGLVGSALGGPIGGAAAKGLTQKMGWSTTGGAQ